MGSGPESTRQTQQATCRTCARQSPVVRGTRDEAVAFFVGLGWLERHDGELLCPICCARAKTVAPPSR